MTGSPGDQTKTCGMCCKEIAFAARVCPFCQFWQGRFARFMRHPLSIVLFLGFMFLMIVAQALMVERMFSRGEPFQPYANQVAVVESKIEFGQTDGYWPIVAIVGRMRNSGDVDWRNTRIQVEFFNSAGRLIDAGQANEFNNTPCLPARDNIAFKVAFPRYFSESEYVSHKVRVVSAIDNRAGPLMH